MLNRLIPFAFVAAAFAQQPAQQPSATPAPGADVRENGPARVCRCSFARHGRPRQRTRHHPGSGDEPESGTKALRSVGERSAGARQRR